VFVAAGVLQWNENKAMLASVSHSKGCGDQGCFNFFDSVYFTVTISVVLFQVTFSSDEYHCDPAYIFNYLKSPLWGVHFVHFGDSLD